MAADGVRTVVAKVVTNPVAEDGTFAKTVTVPDPSVGGMGRFVARQGAYGLRAKVAFSVDQVFG